MCEKENSEIQNDNKDQYFYYVKLRLWFIYSQCFHFCREKKKQFQKQSQGHGDPESVWYSIQI